MGAEKICCKCKVLCDATYMVKPSGAYYCIECASKEFVENRELVAQMKDVEPMAPVEAHLYNLTFLFHTDIQWEYDSSMLNRLEC